MNNMTPRNSVMNAFSELRFLESTIVEALDDAVTMFNTFEKVSNPVKLIHRGVLVILELINGPKDELKAAGLRTTNESWEQPPKTSREAMEEVRKVLSALEPLINLNNGRLPFPEYQSLFVMHITCTAMSIDQAVESRRW